MKSRQLASWPVSVSLALKFYFFSQSFPDIRAKLKRLGKEPLTLQAEVLAMAFKMYHGRDESGLKTKITDASLGLLASYSNLPGSLASQNPRTSGSMPKMWSGGQGLDLFAQAFINHLNRVQSATAPMPLFT